MSKEQPKSTPGPWEWLPRDVLVPVSGRGRWIMSGELSAPDREANAHLIAAAPDLYEALAAAAPLWILAIHEAEKRGDQEFVAHLRAAGAEIDAALAKARGETRNG